MLNQLQGSMGVPLDEARRVRVGFVAQMCMSNPYPQTLVEVVRGVDRTLFEDYIKPKVAHFTALIRKGVTESDVDWFETPRPTEVRQYIHEILISLVAIHAQVSATSRALLERTLAALIVEIVNEALLCFRKISRFGMGGMLRVCHISAPQIEVTLMICQGDLGD